LHHLPKEEAIVTALRIVDDNFGYNPLLGARRQLSAARMLARRGDIARLVAWYSR
jgi:lysine-N-methylase